MWLVLDASSQSCLICLQSSFLLIYLKGKQWSPSIWIADILMGNLGWVEFLAPGGYGQVEGVSRVGRSSHFSVSPSSSFSNKYINIWKILWGLSLANLYQSELTTFPKQMQEEREILNWCAQGINLKYYWKLITSNFTVFLQKNKPECLFSTFLLKLSYPNTKRK